jgi:cyclic beta-1,2-glucan synthetase
MTEAPKDFVAGHSLPLTAPVSEQRMNELPERPTVSDDALRESAAALAQELHQASRVRASGLESRLKKLSTRLSERLRACKAISQPSGPIATMELLENTRMFETVLTQAVADRDVYAEVPNVPVPDGGVPRVLRVAEEYISAVGGIWSQDSLLLYAQAVQNTDPLRLAEVMLLPISIKLAQLEFILDRADEAFALGSMPAGETSPFAAPIHSLRRLNQFEWPPLLEQMIVFNQVLAQDPVNAFATMDEDSRAAYRQRVEKLAKRADLDEIKTAEMALQMARAAALKPYTNSRLTERMSHVGYYLFEEGLPEFSHRIGYHPPPADRMRAFLKRNSEEIYILGISILSILLITAFIVPIVPHSNFIAVVCALFVALLPATQGASDLVNNTVTAILMPRALPKLDYLERIPEESSTLVVIPTLLINEEQVCEMFDQLEARYLANPDINLHFALLTDLPDSHERPQHEDRHSLVELAISLADGLNAKYGHEKYGCFFLLHRRRVFNARQGVWMGWERKRGKLIDLNRFLMGTFDSFPIKAGPVEILSKIRYVITLDSDTQLPRGTAARLIGAIAHPLNRAIIDDRSKIVKTGYGILQPRVGVSVASASRSRLAALFSGETGFDIYTRAVSDVYQDLFDEGSFTGKGIYEVSILHEVLDCRFPPNFLLSHDLIEGAYARAGLATDIEVIDDYPSHYSAHTRRKHRWVRGDWQIIQWLSPRVPDESGKLTRNPISIISEWKIFDNLRRSLIEPVTFLLLVLGWFVLPGGPLYWTLVTLTLLFLPLFVQLGFNLGRAVLELRLAQAEEAFRTFFSSLGISLLNLAFLPHQMLLSLDAIVRSLVRRFVTGKRLLEWETAAQSEANRTQSTLDVYLQLSPVVALVLAGSLRLAHPKALLVACPILVLWALAPLIVGWLNSPPRKIAAPLSDKDQTFLEEHALLLWRYFAEFGGEENHWLIPDNVEEQGIRQARTLSPTNLGMLINARQAAKRLGFLTLPEFTHATLETLRTFDRLEKFNGHIYNWYDIETLRAMQPMIVSTVDSGNLAASLYTLHSGALEILKRPLVDPQQFVALARLLRRLGAGEAQRFGTGTDGLRKAVAWLTQLQPLQQISEIPFASWQAEEAAGRRDAILSFVTEYAPWLLPRFAPLFGILQFGDPENEIVPPLEHAVDYAQAMDERLSNLAALEPQGSQEIALIQELQTMLASAVARLERLADDVREIAREAERHADAMHYDFLFDESRQLLSIAFLQEPEELHSACYDLLASEARVAYFLAIAKGDIPQRAWFRLGRTHALVNHHAALLSWTGTMFEYLMPSLWIHNYPDTLITRSLDSCVAIQQEHVRGIPWGISESGFAKTDPNGRYSYQAWGIPGLALKYAAEDGPVISPYSSFLALPFARRNVLSNLRKMAAAGWVGAYGFYEAADYTESAQPSLVRSWMAHHQGMALLAATNLLCGNVFQSWFHANPKVRATELLLYERPLSRQTLKHLQARSAQTATDEEQSIS